MKCTLHLHNNLNLKEKTMQYKKYLPMILGVFLSSAAIYIRQAPGEVRIVDKSNSAIVVGEFNSPCKTTTSDPTVKDALKEINELELTDNESSFKIADSTEIYSRGGNNTSSSYSSKYGELLDWWTEVDNLIPRGAIFQVRDFYTNKTFNLKRTFGTNHADVEALTLQDTNTIKSIWGDFSWDRRPVVVYYSGRSIAASLSAMPHAGLDSKPSEELIKDRSGDYGLGMNLDAVKNNGMDGVIDLHFLNSRTHGSDKIDTLHQAAIHTAAGK